jgi:hypothetical protein
MNFIDFGKRKTTYAGHVFQNLGNPKIEINLNGKNLVIPLFKLNYRKKIKMFKSQLPRKPIRYRRNKVKR